MSKETMGTQPCPGCGQEIQFEEYHVAHCPNLGLAPEPEKKKRRRRRRRGSSTPSDQVTQPA